MLSLLIVCRQIDENLLRTVKSVEKLQPQILVDVSSESSSVLGERKNRLIQATAYEWVLVLDTDEAIDSLLFSEICKVVNNSQTKIMGYKIPYRNYAFNRIMKSQSENYSKIRLFRGKFGTVTQSTVHEEVVVNGEVGKLNGYIIHNSFRTLPQVLIKFTKYAWQMAGEKWKVHEGVTLKKLFLYGPHMVWARTIKDEGWRDGWRGIVIALCFGYMETLMYWLLLFRNIFTY